MASFSTDNEIQLRAEESTTHDRSRAWGAGRRRYGVLLSVVFLACGCNLTGDRSPVIATVDGRAIHRSRLERFLTVKLGDLGMSEASDSIRSQMLDEFIRRQLVIEEAGRSGLSVSDAEIDQQAQEDPKLKSTASASEARQEMAADLLVEKYYRQVVLKDVKVTPEEIDQYIQQNQSRLTAKPGFYVREIRVQSKEEADKLREELTDGHHDFASVARLHSDAPNAAGGGLARYEEGQLPAPIERAITPLAPGDISEVVESGYGFHIFKLEKRIQPHAPDERRSRLDDRRKQLAEELIERRNQDAVDEALKRLTAAANIRIYYSALGFTYDGALRHN